MVMLRESKGTAEEDLPALKAAEEKARKSMAMWFYGLGSRDPNKADGKRRPLYSVTVPDLVLMGEVSADARADANGDASKISDCFLNYLVFETARILKKRKPLTKLKRKTIRLLSWKRRWPTTKPIVSTLWRSLPSSTRATQLRKRSRLFWTLCMAAQRRPKRPRLSSNTH